MTRIKPITLPRCSREVSDLLKATPQLKVLYIRMIKNLRRYGRDVARVSIRTDRWHHFYVEAPSLGALDWTLRRAVSEAERANPGLKWIISEWKIEARWVSFFHRTPTNVYIRCTQSSKAATFVEMVDRHTEKTLEAIAVPHEFATFDDIQYVAYRTGRFVKTTPKTEQKA